MDNKERIEMTDEQLDEVVGGLSPGDHVRVNSLAAGKCPGCGKMMTGSFEGTIVACNGMTPQGHRVYTIKKDCCGFEMGATDFFIEIQ